MAAFRPVLSELTGALMASLSSAPSTPSSSSSSSAAATPEVSRLHAPDARLVKPMTELVFAIAYETENPTELVALVGSLEVLGAFRFIFGPLPLLSFFWAWAFEILKYLLGKWDFKKALLMETNPEKYESQKELAKYIFS